MCWVMTTAGLSAGRLISTSLVASVPPVDAPMKMSFSVDALPRLAIVIALTGAAAGAPGAGAAGARRMCALDAMRILSVMSWASCRMPSATPILGLATKSIAPSSNALSVTSAPRSVSVDTITTGIGRRRIRRDRKSSPSIRGISTSSVMTSGFRLRIISRASSGSAAAPMHSMSVWRLMISERIERTSAESSTTTTLVLAISASSEQIDGAAAAGDRLHLLDRHAVLLDQRVGVGGCQALDHGLAAGRQEADLARVHVHHVLGHDGNALQLEVVDDEIGVALTDIERVHARDDRAATEDLGFHAAFVGAALHHLVDQQFHCKRAVAARVAIALGQHEVIHATDLGHAVPQAGRDAGAQCRHDQQVLLVDEILARQDLDRRVLEMGVIEEERGLALAAWLGLELVDFGHRGRVAQGRGGGERSAHAQTRS
mmetsp:Transcript_60042/g.142143  ORF Transcript_60042/g.142143 Transcript_60042/m.142143 type:complete len:430 (+) Transcript_60042:474-1763(+)